MISRAVFIYWTCIYVELLNIHTYDLECCICILDLYIRWTTNIHTHDLESCICILDLYIRWTTWHTYTSSRELYLYIGPVYTLNYLTYIHMISRAVFVYWTCIYVELLNIHTHDLESCICILDLYIRWTTWHTYTSSRELYLYIGPVYTLNYLTYIHMISRAVFVYWTCIYVELLDIHTHDLESCICILDLYIRWTI